MIITADNVAAGMDVLGNVFLNEHRFSQRAAVAHLDTIKTYFIYPYRICRQILFLMCRSNKK